MYRAVHVLRNAYRKFENLSDDNHVVQTHHAQDEPTINLSPNP